MRLMPVSSLMWMGNPTTPSRSASLMSASRRRKLYTSGSSEYWKSVRKLLISGFMMMMLAVTPAWRSVTPSSATATAR